MAKWGCFAQPLPTEFPAMKARSKATAESRAPVATSRRVQRFAPAGTRTREAVWADGFPENARAICKAVISGATTAERLARAALAVLDKKESTKDEMQACVRWMRTLLPLLPAFRRFEECEPLGRTEFYVYATYERAKRLLHGLAQDFARRRDIYELAENAELARASVDALVPAGGNDQPWAPSFAPLRRNLVGWLVNCVAPENVGKLNFEDEAQSMTAAVWRRTERQVQDIVGRSRAWDRVESPILFADLESLSAGAVKK